MAIGQELLNVPMGDMIRQMAFAIAEAQVRLDEASISVAEMMGGLRTVVGPDGKITFDDSRVFFGHEYMSVKEARAYLSVDDALTGGVIGTALETIKDAQEETGVTVTDDTEIRVPTRVSMLELGFAPTFYQFVDTIIEVKIAIKITRSSSYTTTTSNKTTSDEQRKAENSNRPWWGWFGSGSSSSSGQTVSTSQVDATYSSKYGYSAEGASLLRTKLAPLPPPPILEERIRNVMEMEEARRKAKREAETEA